jgi:uncharacterized protein
MTLPRLVGMVHLGPLPGAPRFAGSLQSVVDRAVADASVLAETGFDAVMVENYGDEPFFADDVPKITVAAMTRAVAEVRGAVPIPVGVNVLRNDALAALAVAAVTGASFIRVNVLSGAMVTDQGLIQGRAAEVTRERAALGGAAIWADVHVKHAVPLGPVTLEDASRDAFHRAGADVLIVSGPSTGVPASADDVARVRNAVPGAPVMVGSGVTVETVARFLAVANGVIAGTALKRDGVTAAAVDPERAAALVAAARQPTSS